MTMKIAYLDLETNGLVPGLHTAWEFGLILRHAHPDLGVGGGYGGHIDTEYLWRTTPDWERADPEAMRVNRCAERTAHMEPRIAVAGPCNLALPDAPQMWSLPEQVSAELAGLLDGAVVVGANPGFDVDFLKPLFVAHELSYRAHYRPLDITTLTWGYLNNMAATDGLRWPLSSQEISRRLGVDPDDYERHTALGDCRWVRDQWDVIV